MTQSIAFFDVKPYDRLFFDQANKNFSFEIKYLMPHLNVDTAELARGCQAVCIFVNDTIDAPTVAVLEKTGVRLIALRSAGFNNVDLKAVQGKFKVVRVPAYSPHAVAEHAIALILCLNRKIHRAYNRVRDGNFTLNGLLGYDLFGKTAGIIGVGRVGRCLVEILRGFGVRVLLYDAMKDDAFAQKHGASYVDLPTLCRESDIISLHCPLTRETHHIIDDKSIASMKDGVVLVNTGRGELINTQSLINALKTGKVSAAGLDVYEEEGDYFFEDFSSKIVDDDELARLMTFPNVLITAHQGFFTAEAMHNIAATTLSNIKDFFDGKPLTNEVTQNN